MSSDINKREKFSSICHKQFVAETNISDLVMSITFYTQGGSTLIVDSNNLVNGGYADFTDGDYVAAESGAGSWIVYRNKTTALKEHLTSLLYQKKKER